MHVYTLSTYTLVISRNISVHEYEHHSILLRTAEQAFTGSGVKLCFEKMSDIPFLSYYGCSKLLKARAMLYGGTHTRLTVSVGIDPSLTKTRHARRVIVYTWTKELELVLYGKLYITRMRASYTMKRNILLRFYGISHACANCGSYILLCIERIMHARK